MNYKTAQEYLETEENVLGSIKYTFSGKQIAEMMEAYANQFRKKKDYGRNGGVECDTDDGPCACGAWHKPDKATFDKERALSDLADRKKISENRIQEEYYDRNSPHYRDNSRYADAVKSINEKYAEAIQAIDSKSKI